MKDSQNQVKLKRNPELTSEALIHQYQNKIKNGITEERDKNLYLDLIQFTLCDKDYSARDDIKRDIEHVIALSVLYQNPDFVHCLMAVHEVQSSISHSAIIETKPDIVHNTDSFYTEMDNWIKDNRKSIAEKVIETILNNHILTLTPLSYSQIRKLCRKVFKVQADKLYVRRVCDLSVTWGWLSKRGDGYIPNVDMLLYSAVHRTLLFDAELYEHKYADQLEELDHV